MRPTPIQLALAGLLVSTGSTAVSQVSAGGGARPSSAATGNGAPGDKLVCKKRLKTGTLADYEKICHTKAEWERIGAAWRDTWGEIQGSKGSTKGN